MKPYEFIPDEVVKQYFESGHMEITEGYWIEQQDCEKLMLKYSQYLMLEFAMWIVKERFMYYTTKNEEVLWSRPLDTVRSTEALCHEFLIQRNFIKLLNDLK